MSGILVNKFSLLGPRERTCLEAVGSLQELVFPRISTFLSALLLINASILCANSFINNYYSSY